MAKFEHDGTVYPSLTDFVNRFAHESVTDRTFGDRLKRGWSVEDALTKSTQKPVPPWKRKNKEGQNESENNDC